MCYKARLYLVKELEFNYNKEITNPDAIKEFLIKNTSLMHEPEEVLILINLNTNNTVINYFEVSRGAIDRTIACPREIIKRILLSNAAKFILAHNHPSGNLSLSNYDIEVHKKMRQIGELVEVELLDSIVINQDGNITSIKENIEIF